MVATTASSVESTLSLITEIDVRQWGRDVTIEGLDDPLTRHRTTLIFSGCRDIRWSSHGDASSDTEADVIGICLGRGDYVEAAVITTALFELTIHYRKLTVGTVPEEREAFNANLAAV